MWALSRMAPAKRRSVYSPGTICSELGAGDCSARSPVTAASTAAADDAAAQISIGVLRSSATAAPRLRPSAARNPGAHRSRASLECAATAPKSSHRGAPVPARDVRSPLGRFQRERSSRACAPRRPCDPAPRTISVTPTRVSCSRPMCRCCTSASNSATRISAITLKVYARWLPDETRRRGVDRLDETQPSATPAQPARKIAVGENAVSLGRKVVSRLGIEPRTRRLRVCCSAS